MNEERTEDQPMKIKLPRLDIVDALRGFAVMLIVLIHSVEHFLYPVYPDVQQQP
ncbi:DUF1624 domain-containing protein [Elizabethkingia sp. JS20170427COW]|uniref:DUF1624 domain-containing protein n=1 Tax=Elizabethkingia sp. JS20170427COW TaxID=2583851 RepID=UPI001C871EC9|nr:DUF1624 domain-containing protein [Elizabethkingia sp. JS20170427COW]